jgi:hypothetical protein
MGQAQIKFQHFVEHVVSVSSPALPAGARPSGRLSSWGFASDETRTWHRLCGVRGGGGGGGTAGGALCGRARDGLPKLARQAPCRSGARVLRASTQWSLYSHRAPLCFVRHQCTCVLLGNGHRGGNARVRGARWKQGAKLPTGSTAWPGRLEAARRSPLSTSQPPTSSR